jgi:hypothetical protein
VRSEETLLSGPESCADGSGGPIARDSALPTITAPSLVLGRENP